MAVGATIPIEFVIRDRDGHPVIDRSVTLVIRDAYDRAIVGPIGIGGHSAQAISFEGQTYHYDFQTTGLPAALYVILLPYNSANPSLPVSQATLQLEDQVQF